MVYYPQAPLFKAVSRIAVVINTKNIVEGEAPLKDRILDLFGEELHLIVKGEKNEKYKIKIVGVYWIECLYIFSHSILQDLYIDYGQCRKFDKPATCAGLAF
jgi:hypothetical protein